MAKLSEALREVPFAVLVLVQDDLTDADCSRLAIAGRDLMWRVEIDHVLPPRGELRVRPGLVAAAAVE